MLSMLVLAGVWSHFILVVPKMYCHVMHLELVRDEEGIFRPTFHLSRLVAKRCRARLNACPGDMLHGIFVRCT